MPAKKRILVLGIRNISNVGDEIISRSTMFLTGHANEDIDCEFTDFIPNGDQLASCYKSRMSFRVHQWVSQRIYNLRHFFPERFAPRFRNAAFCIYQTRYYRKWLDGVDGVIICAGMLKFSTQDHSYAFDVITSAAERRSLPVMLSAMSVARPDLNDWRYRQLVRAVNRNSVKVITSRDGSKGVERLKCFYLKTNSRVRVDGVADAAFWIPEIFCVAQTRTSFKKVGINLPRLGLFNDYDGGIADKELLKFYQDLIEELSVQNCEWCLFSNGIAADERFGQILLQRLQLPEDRMLPRTQDAGEYLSRLQGFSAVLAARFHTCLSCFVLGIPFMGMLWDDKLRLFAQEFDQTTRFLESGDLDGKTVARKLLSLDSCKIDLKKIAQSRNKTRDAICQFVKGCVAIDRGKLGDRGRG